MNEAQIREQLRQAVGEAAYPSYLPARVEDRLKGLGGGSGWRGSRTLIAVLAVLLVAALAVGVLAWRDGGLFNRAPLPADQGQSIRQYQAMMAFDSQDVISAQSNNCATLTDACPAGAGRVIAALQTWLDDLNASQPPARFAYIELQMHRQIVLVIADLHAAVAAYNAKSQTKMDAAIGAAVIERDALLAEVDAIFRSTPATVATYKAKVRTDDAYLVQCSGCETLVSQTPMSCSASPASICLGEVSAARTVVETFQADLVHHFSPGSLATADAILQADLFDADLALASMAAAVPGDHAAFEAGRNNFRRLLSRIDADAAAVARD
jgi:hypothetical protein